MFDLEKSIIAWRRHLEFNRAFCRDDLDELEQHLRDEIAGRVAGGVLLSLAFQETMREMGDYGTAEREYRKVFWGKSRRQLRLSDELIWSLSMIKNYFLVALRNARRHLGFSSINVIGLSLGVGCCLMILLFLQDELGYDRFHGKGDRIYRVVSDLRQSAQLDFHKFGTVGWPVGRTLAASFPEVEQVVYMRTGGSAPVNVREERWYEQIRYADEHFFEVFDFPMHTGDPATALREPFSVVLSDELAGRLFPDEPALGRTVTLSDTLDFTVTGVVSVPRQSHVQFDLLASLPTLKIFYGEQWESRFETSWLDVNMFTYVLLREQTDAAAFSQKISTLPMERYGDSLREWGTTYYLSLVPLRDIYLNIGGYRNGLGSEGSLDALYLLGSIALLVLLVAGINYINLATASSVDRAKEIGVRKVMGAFRLQLIRQYLTEAFLMCGTAVVFGFLLMLIALPVFNDLIGKAYRIEDLLSWSTLVGAVSLVLLLGGIAGLYPAMVLSRFQPVKVLKGRYAAHKQGGSLRRGLIVVQFTVAVVLVVATLVVGRQLRFLQRQNPGFSIDQLLAVRTSALPSGERAAVHDAFRTAIERHSAVRSTSAVSAIPGRNGWRSIIAFPEGWADGESMLIEYLAIDEGFVPTLDVELAAGRNLDLTLQTDVELGLLINEAMVEAAGWETPEEAVGKHITMPGGPGKTEAPVVGVMRDYHQHGFQEAVQPIVFGVTPWAVSEILVRFDPGNTEAVLAHLDRSWSELVSDYNIDRYFVEAAFDEQYAAEKRLARTFSIATGLALLVGCLGLIGLATFITRQRTREMGIRKVLGAPTSNLLLLLTSDLFKWIGLSIITGGSTSYFLMRRWLEDFAHQIPLGPGVFLTAASLVLLFSFFTVSFQTFRTAMTNPVKSLRHE